MLRRALALALPTALLLAAACGGGGDGPTLETPRAEGTYQLVSYQGQRPPMIAFQSSSQIIKILGGRWVLRTDGSYTRTDSSRTVVGADSTDRVNIDTGTWQAGAARVNFSSSDGTAYFARWSGNTLTFQPSEPPGYVYEKQ